MRLTISLPILLAFFAISTTFTMMAQPILTSAAAPAMGTKTHGHVVTGNLTHSAAGAAQTWNFGSIAHDPSSFYFVEVPFSGLSQQIKDTFPKGNNASELIQAGAKVATIVGRLESAFQATLGLAYTASFQKYAKADTFLILPMNYLDAFDKRKYDAYGTLTTPFGTYTNVIRIQEDVALSASPANKFRYLYFQASPVYRLLMEYKVEKTTSALDGKYFYNLEFASSGIDDMSLENDLLINPNPFTNEIITKVVNENQSEIILYDITGKEIMRSKENKLNTSNLDAGVYWLHAADKNYKVVKN